MKFGTIAAILIAFGAPLLVLTHIFSPSGIFELHPERYKVGTLGG